MLKKSIKTILSHFEDTEEIQAYGWVRTKRESKKIAFISLNDGSCQDNLQVIVSDDSPAFKKIKEIQTGASLKCIGLLQKSPAKGQACELIAQEIEILGNTTENYPLQKKGHSLEFLREIAHLRGRTNTFGAIFRVRNALAQGVHKFFSEEGFYWAHTPILTASDCEGAGELFKVTTLGASDLAQQEKDPKVWDKDFFGKPSYLSVSGQLQAEILALSMGKVYTFGPTFRAENSNTSRHLAEFWMIEPEMAFYNLRENIELAEKFIRYLASYALEHSFEELKFFEKFYKKITIKELEKLATTPFEHITYTEAIKLLEESGKDFEYPVKWGCDLQTEHERYLTEYVFKKPISVRDYPKDIKPFYMRLNDDNKTVAAMDILVPKVGELVGGSQREERFDRLELRMKEQKVATDDLWWYLDLRRQGSAEHSGFGLGFERLVMYFTGMQNIRDVILCPRSSKSINF